MLSFRFMLVDSKLGTRLFDTMLVSQNFDLAIYKCMSFAKMFAEKRNRKLNVTIIKFGNFDILTPAAMMKIKCDLRKRFLPETTEFILHCPK